MYNLYRLYIRPVIGITLLVIMLVWASKEGELFERINARYLLLPVLISIFSVVMGGLILQRIAVTFNKHLRFSSALLISALGTFGNSLGGLPLGTTIKYAALYKKSGLAIKETTLALSYSP